LIFFVQLGAASWINRIQPRRDTKYHEGSNQRSVNVDLICGFLPGIDFLRATSCCFVVETGLTTNDTKPHENFL